MHRQKILSTAIAAALTLTMGGCTMTSKGMQRKVDADMTHEIAKHTAQPKHYGLAHVKSARDVPGTPYTDIDLNDDSGTVSINISGAIGPTVQGYVKAIGYGLAWTEGAAKEQKVSLNLSGVSEKSAIRKLAAAAGYVAIFDHNARLVTIARTATYVFRLPRHVMQSESAKWSMNNGGGGSGSSSTGSSGGSMSGSMGGSSGGSGMGGRANFSAEGSSSNPAASITEYLTKLAGDAATVNVSPEAGHIAVRGGGVAIERVRGYLQKLANRAQRQVLIDVAVIDIGIGRESSMGIDWSRTLNALNGDLGIALTAAGDVATPAMAVSYTSASVASIINLLRSKNDLKIITQPKITATNGVPTMIFDGREIPYIGEITTTATDTVTTQGAEVSYATDGVSLAAVTDILSDSEAHLTLVPTISSIQELVTFSVGAATAVAPRRTTKEALISTVLRDGQTAVIGGIRYTTDNKDTKLLPLVDAPVARNTNRASREIAFLLSARISPEKHQPILFSESL